MVLRKIGFALAAAAAVTAGALASAAPASAAPAKLSQSAAAAKLGAAGITHSSSGGCTARSKPTCTSYEQINASTVDGISTLKRASGCGINITGGTEVGHAAGTYSHYNGYKVDITPNSCVSAYIRRSFTRIVPPSFGSEQYRSSAGNTYTYEGNHWDIEYH
ncbi:hypothetical protein [Amycolatopsis sp. CA-230715]|uniref:hypothetical protein n=1 Tax=Amycolatopsis sp. CA-230715 TaxID=2745196 RepID=UPI001C0215D3|nr:hypothetical protein [Amycolatopsis sp. CA-230715]QWF79144.1 hypothetical protein HUW46_02551 [Amycolatopsis sp. CA-230715]